jgi:hypothetical protein
MKFSTKSQLRLLKSTPMLMRKGCQTNWKEHANYCLFTLALLLLGTFCESSVTCNEIPRIVAHRCSIEAGIDVL